MNLDSPRQLIAAPAAAGQHGRYLSADGQLFTVTGMLSALRRRWRLWAATAVAGVIAALALSVVSPPAYSATTILRLRHPSQSDGSRAMATDAELLETRVVAQAAIDRLDLPLPAKEFISRYQAAVLSDELLAIRVQAPTGIEARRRANALAEAFLAFRRDEFERDLQVALDTLEHRTGTLIGELEAVNEKINNFSAGNSDAAVRGLGDLLTKRTSINDELGELRGRIDQVTRDTNTVVEKSRVVDPASEDDRSPVRTVAGNVAAGLVGGLSLGTAWIVGHEVVSDRVRRRQDIAAALGTPVPVSIGPLEGPVRVQRRRLRQGQRERGRDLAKMVTHLRGSLSHRAHQRALVVVSVGSDGPAALAVGLLAVDLAKEGKDVLVADLSRGSVLAGLFRVSDQKTSTVDHEHASRVTLGFPLSDPEYDTGRDHWRELQGERSDEPDVVLALATLDPAVGADHLTGWATTAVAVVTAGRSSAAGLRSTSEMLRAAGLEIVSAVLVAADPHDESLGVADPSSSRLLQGHLLTTGSANAHEPNGDQSEPEDTDSLDLERHPSPLPRAEAPAGLSSLASTGNAVRPNSDPSAPGAADAISVVENIPSPRIDEAAPLGATENARGAKGTTDHPGGPEDAV